MLVCLLICKLVCLMVLCLEACLSTTYRKFKHIASADQFHYVSQKTVFMNIVGCVNLCFLYPLCWFCLLKVIFMLA